MSKEMKTSNSAETVEITVDQDEVAVDTVDQDEVAVDTVEQDEVAVDTVEQEKQRVIQETLYNEVVAYLKGLIESIQSETKDTIYDWYGVYVIKDIANILSKALSVEQLMIVKNNIKTIKHPTVIKKEFLGDSLNSIAPVMFALNDAVTNS